jgi:phospholipase A1/A2
MDVHFSWKKCRISEKFKIFEGVAMLVQKPKIISCFYSLIYTLFFLTFCPSVHASETSILISISTEVQASGEDTDFTLYVLNEDNQEMEFSFPKQLKLLIVTEDAKTLTLMANEKTSKGPPQKIAPRAFAKQEYRFRLPEGQNGKLHVSIPEYNRAKAILFARSPEKNKDDTSAQESVDSSEKFPKLENLFALYQPYVPNISAYEPIYFLVGTDPGKSKFQISLKYRLLNPEGTLSQRFPWLSGFHIGYTQTSFWDLRSDSAPFEDTSYKPEFFFLSKNFKERPKWLQGLFLQAGLQHESNGRGFEFSRSTNFAYIKPYFIHYNPQSNLGLQVSPKFWFYVNNDDETNSDLPDYRGYFELETKFGKADSFLLTTNFRPAAEGVSFQGDLSYPISNLIGNNFDLYLHIQYTNALAESLLDYQQRTEALRVGFSIVR